MEDIKNSLKKNLEHIDERVKPFELKNTYYSCSECQSAIEILKLDEEFIEFNCNNNHNIKMKIKEYLDKLKESKDKMNLNADKKPNNDKCN